MDGNELSIFLIDLFFLNDEATVLTSLEENPHWIDHPILLYSQSAADGNCNCSHLFQTLYQRDSKYHSKDKLYAVLREEVQNGICNHLFKELASTGVRQIPSVKTMSVPDVPYGQQRACFIEQRNHSFFVTESTIYPAQIAVVLNMISVARFTYFEKVKTKCYYTLPSFYYPVFLTCFTNNKEMFLQLFPFYFQINICSKQDKDVMEEFGMFLVQKKLICDLEKLSFKNLKQMFEFVLNAMVVLKDISGLKYFISKEWHIGYRYHYKKGLKLAPFCASVFEKIVKSDEWEILEIFMKSGIEVARELLRHSANQNKPKNVKWILKHIRKANFLKSKQAGYLPDVFINKLLCTACIENNFEIIRYLVESNLISPQVKQNDIFSDETNVNQNIKNTFYSPLHWAKLLGNSECEAELMSGGFTCDMKITNNFCFPPAVMLFQDVTLCRMTYEEVIDQLLFKGYSLQSTTAGGFGILNSASRLKNPGE